MTEILSRDALGRITDSAGHVPSSFNIGEVIGLYMVGFSIQQVARIVGAHRAAVQRRLIKYGIPRHSRGRLGITRSDAFKKNLSEKAKQRLALNPPIGSKNPFYGKKHRPESIQQAREKLSIRFSGAGNPQWQGGKSLEPYAPGFAKVLKRYILSRDGHRCRICATEVSLPRSLVVHHIDYDKANHAYENLASLCRPCHRKLHAGKISLQP